ncbi:MAG TPA: SDR family NAD(P)-dependent oxidoreductase [Stellaceae bacterium]|nr:SDR family NAD(P)-dependent oxidoreductase [Stellaceae bacterium]
MLPPLVIPDLASKACLGTGSSRGIGAAVARGLGACGARVAVHYNTGKAEAEAVAVDIAQAGRQAILLAGDLSTPGMSARLIDEMVRQFGHLDSLINNAGDVIERYPVAETPDELFERHVAVNIRPVFEDSRRAVLQFRAQGGGGTIVNVSSVVARTSGGSGSSLYASAKAFVATFTRALAKEVAKEKIRVNAVSPGVIDTPMQDRTTPVEQINTALAAIPVARLERPDECVGQSSTSALRHSAATLPARFSR